MLKSSLSSPLFIKRFKITAGTKRRGQIVNECERKNYKRVKQEQSLKLVGRSSSVPSEPLFGPRCLQGKLRETFKESQTEQRTLKASIRGGAAEHLMHAGLEARSSILDSENAGGLRPEMWRPPAFLLHLCQPKVKEAGLSY